MEVARAKELLDALTALFDEAEAKAASRAAAEAGDDELVARPSARERGVPAPSFAVLLPTRDAASGMKRHELIGTVEGRDVIMVDSIIDSGGTIARGAAELKAR